MRNTAGVHSTGRAAVFDTGTQAPVCTGKRRRRVCRKCALPAHRAATGPMSSRSVRARHARMAPAAYGAKDASAVTSKMPDRGAIPDLSDAQHLQRRAPKVAHSRTHAPAQAHRFAQIDFKSRLPRAIQDDLETRLWFTIAFYSILYICLSYLFQLRGRVTITPLI